MTNINDLLRRAKKQLAKRKSKKVPRTEVFRVERCDHADVECPCPCRKHNLNSKTVPKNCVCDQFHNPPEKPCGCERVVVQSSNPGFKGPRPLMLTFGYHNRPEASRNVRDMYRLISYH